jgi:cysteine desulfurase
MHVNNEIGTVLDLDRIVPICKQYNALLHSDTVQSIGKGNRSTRITHWLLVASAHKFHGPKGCGFAFVRKNSGLQPLFWWEQEKACVPERKHQIAGMAKALELSYDNLEEEGSDFWIEIFGGSTCH